MRQNPSFVSSGLFLFFHKVSDSESQPSCVSTRIGISVSKKICSKAVGRNYIKRRIREVFRRSEFRSLGRDVMIVVNRKRFKNLEHAKESIEGDLLAGFKKIANS